jgi:hypothetical protein
MGGFCSCWAEAARERQRTTRAERAKEVERGMLGSR